MSSFGMNKSAVQVMKEARFAKQLAKQQEELAVADLLNDTGAQVGILAADETKLECALNRRAAMKESTLGASLRGYL